MAAAAPKKVAARLAEGDWVDVLDNEGVWNVAQVLAIKTSSSVCVRYDGWGAAYDEDIDLSTGRIAPYHTYTWTVKCWAKYLNWPWWPCVTTIRAPGNATGIAHLRTETKLYCDFLDTKEPDRRFRSWIQKSKIVPYDDHFGTRRKHTSGSDFEDALLIMLQSNATTKFPTFVRGTLPKQFESSPAEHALKMKKSMGELWVRSFANNRRRHADAHAYKYQDGFKPQVTVKKEPKKAVALKAKAKLPVPEAGGTVGDTNKASPRYSQEMLVVRTDIILDSDEDDDKILRRPQSKRVRRISPSSSSKQKKPLLRVKDYDPTDDEEDDEQRSIPRRISPRINGKPQEQQPKVEEIVDNDNEEDEEDNVILRPRARRTKEQIVSAAKATTPKGSSTKEPAKRTKALTPRSSSTSLRESSITIEEPKTQKKRVLELSTKSAQLSSSGNQWQELFKKVASHDNPPKDEKKSKEAEVPRVSDTDAASADMEYPDFDSIEESDAASVESLGIADSWDNARNHSFLVLDDQRPNVVEAEKLKKSKELLTPKRSRSSSFEAEVDYTRELKGVRMKSAGDERPAKKPATKKSTKSKSLLDQQIFIALGNLDQEKPKKPSSKPSRKHDTEPKKVSKTVSTDSGKAKSSHKPAELEPSEITSRAVKKPKKASSTVEDDRRPKTEEKPMIFFCPPSKFDDSQAASKGKLSPVASGASARALEAEFLRHRFDPANEIRPATTSGIHSSRHIGPSRLMIYATDRSPRRLMADAPRLASSSADFSMNGWFQGRMCASFLG